MASLSASFLTGVTGLWLQPSSCVRDERSQSSTYQREVTKYKLDVGARFAAPRHDRRDVRPSAAGQGTG